MSTTKMTITKQLPQFSTNRCKQCGICVHFCALNAIGNGPDRMPYLADPNACTSCGVCCDMCPDWAVSLEPTPIEVEQEDTDPTAAETEEALVTR
jgi:2-oxoglutarate ferredoxin oxidoreductase subunit delta